MTLKPIMGETQGAVLAFDAAPDNQSEVQRWMR